MCRALKVLCAAADPARLAGLRRAAVSAHWEVAGGAVGPDELAAQASRLSPDVAVLDGGLGPEAVVVLRRLVPGLRIVAVGRLPGADAEAETLGALRDAILGLPSRGPVRR